EEDVVVDLPRRLEFRGQIREYVVDVADRLEFHGQEREERQVDVSQRLEFRGQKNRSQSVDVDGRMEFTGQDWFGRAVDVSGVMEFTGQAEGDACRWTYPHQDHDDFANVQPTLTCYCPAELTQPSYQGGFSGVWGSGPYAPGSQICRAAVHAGVIGLGGGWVTTVLGAGQDSWEAGEQNGVEGLYWPGPYPISFSFR
ncbi:MAG: LCCL domain-containing protein, partial [Alphaproteobacteria bacterium]|nr:LCCL domain-containing protein [Alphaproteobacteria bacterium]